MAQKYLQGAIRRLMQINDRIASASVESDLARMQEQRLLVAAMIYALSLVVSEPENDWRKK